jgi:cell division protein FtsW (lipid II flippase)
MKPQSQPDNTPNHRPASSPRKVERPTAIPISKPVEDIDFYALRQNRIREDEKVAKTVITAPSAPAERRHVAKERAKLSPNEEEKFEKLVTGKSKKQSCAPCHWGLLVSAILLTAISVPLVYSASTPIALDQHAGDPDFFLKRQLIFGILGLISMVLLSRLDREGLRKAAWIFYGVAVLGLLATKFSPLGSTMGNTERWLKLGPLTVQMSEVAKIALIGVMADFWSRATRKPINSWAPWGFCALIAVFPIVLAFIQPHLSATLVLVSIVVFAAIFAGAPSKHLWTLLGGAVVLLGLTLALCKTHSMPFLAPYQQDRIAAKLGGGDHRDSDYQSLQGQRAIIRGGVLGVGLGASQYKHGHLPAPHTDFVFSVIAEEVGMWGSMTLIGLYLFIVYFCFSTAHNTKNAFEAVLCSGVGAWFGVQACGNIGVASGLLPVTGMPLPVLSYGGSGLVCALMGIGLVLAVSRSTAESVKTT